MKIVVDNENERIDTYLTSKTNFTRSKISKMIKESQILVNNETIKNSYITKNNDVIDINEQEDITIIDIIPQDIPINIVYEDEYLVIINKESGMVVHPAIGHTKDTLANALLYHFDLGDQKGIRPGIVHRIDKDTSGLIVVAKTEKVHEKLSNMIKNKEIKRKYIALVYGIIKHQKGSIDAPIGRDPNDRQKYIVTNINSKDSITHFKVLERYNDATLIECELDTGRTHQIRVHMNYIKHPIVNDPIYGNKKQINDFGQMLHSYYIEFKHPITNKNICFNVDTPNEFKKILSKFK